MEKWYDCIKKSLLILEALSEALIQFLLVVVKITCNSLTPFALMDQDSH